MFLGVRFCVVLPGNVQSKTAHITVQPNTDIFSYLAKDFRENKNLTSRKCTTQSCQSLRTSYQEYSIDTNQ